MFADYKLNWGTSPNPNSIGLAQNVTLPYLGMWRDDLMGTSLLKLGIQGIPPQENDSPVVGTYGGPHGMDGIGRWTTTGLGALNNVLPPAWGTRGMSGLGGGGLGDVTDVVAGLGGGTLLWGAFFLFVFYMITRGPASEKRAKLKEAREKYKQEVSSIKGEYGWRGHRKALV